MIRSSIKAGIKRLFGGEVTPAQAAPVPPAWRAAPVAKVEPAPAAKVEPPPAPKVEPPAVALAAAADAAAPVEVAPVAVEIAAAVEPAPSVEAAVEAAPPAEAEVLPPAKKSKKKGSKAANTDAVAAAPAAEPAAAAEPVAAAETVAAEPLAAASPQEPATDIVGPPAFNMDQVQELFDEMVRPALQGDGGDIKLVKIENNDIYVRLVGSCQSCPSSVLTMKMGVEALLKEELPGFGSLIQVE